MDIYALSDLHLSLGQNKSMDIFGAEWKNHHLKIQKNWNSIVKNCDLVLIPGDISWAMNIKDAEIDCDFISNLNGRKVLLRGNHDYWWDSVSKVRSRFKDLNFIQNDMFVIENIAVCGSRGWKTPIDESFDENTDRKIYERELIRYRLSLDCAKRQNIENIVFMSHFPILANGCETEFSNILEEYKVKKAVYGHIHGKENFKNIYEGMKNGISYSLVSADYIDFKPIKIYSEGKTWL
ncbi:MAG: metallophosphoesterase [Clostridia bacterium]|nr:metallophosphoesterase [Clostridia bacterium]